GSSQCPVVKATAATEPVAFVVNGQRRHEYLCAIVECVRTEPWPIRLARTHRGYPHDGVGVPHNPVEISILSNDGHDDFGSARHEAGDEFVGGWLTGHR